MKFLIYTKSIADPKFEVSSSDSSDADSENHGQTYDLFLSSMILCHYGLFLA